MLAISIRQPWLWLILEGHRPIHIDDWRPEPAYQGDILLHASKSQTKKEFQAAQEFINFYGLDIQLPESCPVGGIVGRANLVKVCRDYESVWADPMLWSWVLSNVQKLPLVECKGQKGLFIAHHPMAGTKLHAIYPPFGEAWSLDP